MLCFPDAGCESLNFLPGHSAFREKPFNSAVSADQIPVLCSKCHTLLRVPLDVLPVTIVENQDVMEITLITCSTHQLRRRWFLFTEDCSLPAAGYFLHCNRYPCHCDLQRTGSRWHFEYDLDGNGQVWVSCEVHFDGQAVPHWNAGGTGLGRILRTILNDH